MARAFFHHHSNHDYNAYEQCHIDSNDLDSVFEPHAEFGILNSSWLFRWWVHTFKLWFDRFFDWKLWINFRYWYSSEWLWTLYRYPCKCNDFCDEDGIWKSPSKIRSNMLHLLLPIRCLFSFLMLRMLIWFWFLDPGIFLEVGALNFILSWTYQMSSQFQVSSMPMSIQPPTPNRTGLALLNSWISLTPPRDSDIEAAACNNERLFYHVIIGTCFVNCNKPQVWRN